MSDDELDIDLDGEERKISCSYCGETQSLTFVLMPGTGSMTTACSRCAAIMTEARAHLEQASVYYRARQERHDLEARMALLAAAIWGSVGASMQWGVGVGALVGAGALGLFAIVRIARD